MGSGRSKWYKEHIYEAVPGQKHQITPWASSTTARTFRKDFGNSSFPLEYISKLLSALMPFLISNQPASAQRRSWLWNAPRGSPCSAAMPASRSKTNILKVYRALHKIT